MAIIDVRPYVAEEHSTGTLNRDGKCAAGNCGGEAKYTVEGSTETTPRYVWAVCEEHRPDAP